MSKKRIVEWAEQDAKEFERLRLKHKNGGSFSEDELRIFNGLWQRYGEYLYEADAPFKEAVDITSDGLTAVRQLESDGIQITKDQRSAMIRPFFQEAVERLLKKGK
ncbi:hypothetical protein A2G06_16840 (plasmid) [Geobacter anodireducens]|nr:hypothetical protein A2G06_16840 [Geobacter anodireducens]